MIMKLKTRGQGPRGAVEPVGEKSSTGPSDDYNFRGCEVVHSACLFARPYAPAKHGITSTKTHGVAFNKDNTLYFDIQFCLSDDVECNK
jgi:hypothetical protein